MASDQKIAAENMEAAIDEKQTQIDQLEAKLASYAKFSDESPILEQIEAAAGGEEEKTYEITSSQLKQLCEQIKTNTQRSESEEAPAESQNEAVEQKDSTLSAITEEEKSTEYYEADTSKLIRNKDINNVDVLLTTILREMQDMKTKVSVIETAVILGNSKSQDFSSYKPTVEAAPAYPSYEQPQLPKHEEHYKEAYLDKSMQLESLKRELTTLRTSENKLASEKRKERFAAKKFEIPNVVSKHQSTPSSSRNTVPTRASFGLRLQAGQASRRPFTSSAGEKPQPASAKIRSILKSREEASANGEISSEDELSQYNAELLRSGGDEHGYKGKVRPADDFDWTKGVWEPSAGLSQATLDNGNKYLRKVQKALDKQQQQQQKRKVFGEDDEIESSLRNNFIETSNGGLVYRIPSHEYDFDY